MNTYLIIFFNVNCVSLLDIHINFNVFRGNKPSRGADEDRIATENRRLELEKYKVSFEDII